METKGPGALREVPELHVFAFDGRQCQEKNAVERTQAALVEIWTFYLPGSSRIEDRCQGRGLIHDNERINDGNSKSLHV